MVDPVLIPMFGIAGLALIVAGLPIARADARPLESVPAARPQASPLA